MNTFKENYEWGINFIEQIKNILKSQLAHLVVIEVASPEEDMKQSTDMIIRLKAGNVAVRIRRDIPYRDFTIRAYCNGYKTELHKLREGFCDWYLYAWTKEEIIIDWVIIDINKMRNHGLLNEDKRIKMNFDNRTGFIIYELKELENVIIASNFWIKGGK